MPTWGFPILSTKIVFIILIVIIATIPACRLTRLTDPAVDVGGFVIDEYYSIDSCSDLESHVINLSEEQEGPSSPKILKLDDIEDIISRTNNNDYLIECRASAKLNNGDNTYIIFYLEENKNGDRFIGYEDEPMTCDTLEPQIIELTEEQEGPFSPKILKMYELEEIKSTDYILGCKANVKWSKGEESIIMFYLEEDKDGDRFIGYEAPESYQSPQN